MTWYQADRGNSECSSNKKNIKKYQNNNEY